MGKISKPVINAPVIEMLIKEFKKPMEAKNGKIWSFHINY